MIIQLQSQSDYELDADSQDEKNKVTKSSYNCFRYFNFIVLSKKMLRLLAEIRKKNGQQMNDMYEDSIEEKRESSFSADMEPSSKLCY